MATSETTAQDLISRAAAVGIDIAAAIARTGQTVRTAEELAACWKPELRTPERADTAYAEQLVNLVKCFNRREAEDLEVRIAARERSASPTVQSIAGVPMATERQVAYINELRARRTRNGDGDGFMSFTGDPATLTRREASAYIDSLRGEY